MLDRRGRPRFNFRRVGEDSYQRYLVLLSAYPHGLLIKGVFCEVNIIIIYVISESRLLNSSNYWMVVVAFSHLQISKRF